MPIYPIRVPRKSYRGSKEAILRKTIEYNCLVTKVEEYLNKIVKANEDEVQVISYFEIGQELGLTTDTVCEILEPVCGGSNGITIGKGKV